MKLKKALLVAATIFAAVTASQADIARYAQSGFWSNSFGRASDGELMCLASNKFDSRGNQHSVMFKYFADSDETVLQVYKSAWQIPEGTRMTLEVRFDGNEPFVAEDAIGKGGFIEAKIGINFIDAASKAEKMYITFPSGDEPYWWVSMNGGRNAMLELANCVTKMAKPTAPNKPSAAPSKPYGSSPAPAKKPNGPEV
jgi:hypothetical protein